MFLQGQTNDLASRIVAIVAIIILMMAISFIIFFIFSRRRQNHHVYTQQKMKAEFQEQLLKAQIEIQESTYSTIGKELHDNLGQLLSTTKMLIGVTQLQLQNVPDTLTTANATLSTAIKELRLVSRSLDKEWLEQFRFIENLQNEIDRINAGGVIRAIFEYQKVPVSTEKQIILFRIVQEALQNAIKHGKATLISVIEREAGHMLFVTVKDNGCGLPGTFHGMGTNNMRHRAKLCNGIINWESDNGTTVNITLPIDIE